MLTIANFNMHCGIDGWGRPYDHAAVIASLDADVIALEEAWTSEGEPEGQAEGAARLLGYQVVTHALAQGRRVRPQPGAGDSWQARPAWTSANRALYADGVRPQSARVRAMPRWQEAEPGHWGIAVLVRPELAIEASRVLPFTPLRGDQSRRAALVVDLTVEGRPISVAGTHMPHLHLGSHRTWAEMRTRLAVSARPDAVLAGDMNTWGPLVHVFMPGWRRAVIGRSWPTWHPHSQIDHILVRGRVRPLHGEVLPHAGSDHRPVRARLELD